MKRYAPLLLTAVLLCTACQSNTQTSLSDGETSQSTDAAAPAYTTAPAQTEATVEAETLPAPVESTTAPETAEPVTEETSESSLVFEAGVWLTTTDGAPTGYYIMDEDGKSGRTLEFETGTGIGFEYEIGINEVVFRFGSAEDETLYEITGGDQSYVFFQLPNGSAMEMQYDDTLSPDALDFYSNIQLGELALNYYTAQTGYTPGSVATLSNSDGTVTIQLYDNLGDHNSTSAWYTIDRFTAVGTDDISGEQVSLVE